MHVSLCVQSAFVNMETILAAADSHEGMMLSLHHLLRDVHLVTASSTEFTLAVAICTSIEPLNKGSD